MLSRRNFVKTTGIASAAGAASLAGCVGGPAGGGNDNNSQGESKNQIADELTVFTWYEQFHNRMLQEFRQTHSGLNTNLTSYGSNQELYSKLKAAGTDQVDFVLPSNNMVTRLREDDMIQPINTDWLSRWNLQKPFADEKPWSDFLKIDGEYWGVPFARGTYMNTTNKSKVEDGAVPSDLIDSWDLYFEDTEARLAVKDYGRRNVSIVMWHMLGEDADINNDPGNKVAWEEIEKKLVQMIENSKTLYSSSEDARRLMKQDQIDVANVWGGDVIQLQNLSGIEDAEGYFPKQGSNGWFDCFCIPKSAPHAYTSHAYMDFVLKPDRLLKEYEIEGNVAVQKNIIEKMPQSLKTNYEFLLNIDSSQLQPYAANKELQNRATQAWNNAKSRAN
jgi:spermidine/putrescine-binding protein